MIASPKFKIIVCCLFIIHIVVSSNTIDPYNIQWKEQSKNSSESMPCGGGDIGLNVWVENDDVYFYISRSGTFDENNGFLKLGRVKVSLTPNPFKEGSFSQQLKLHDGFVQIKGKNKEAETTINIWVDVFSPVIHIDITSSVPTIAKTGYESWRFEDFVLRSGESFANSLKWEAIENVTTQKDSISMDNNGVLFYHQNLDSTVFDIAVRQQGLFEYKDQMYNPVANLTFGGIMRGENMVPLGIEKGTYLDTPYKTWQLESKKALNSQSIEIYLHTQTATDVENWKKGLEKNIHTKNKSKKDPFEITKNWWHQYWDRSYIKINIQEADTDSEDWQVGRNYQLFRYMLGCNAYGSYPTKFNGGLFTYDPRFTDSTRCFTPDFRNWGGGSFTAQNQRLVYFPMIKSGDLDMLKPQLDFYLNTLGNAELRSKVYWGHKGACFTEQLENFGLPNPAEYGWERPENYDYGRQYNAWLEYQYDTGLEFCLMAFEMERYKGMDISKYIPMIESMLTFFDEHYQYLARERGSKALDGNGHLIIYPGSACETYKMAYNPVSTVAALKVILERLLEVHENFPIDTAKWNGMLKRIPPITYREINGHTTIAPAQLWERVNNTETAQLYPVYPWGIYGIGKPGLDTAINTYMYDPDAIEFRSHLSWKQDNIFAARLGLTDEAMKWTTKKLKDSGRRFPAFWGPGMDWVPDHNWGGSGMIGLQEMLMQVDGEKIILLPAWPQKLNVHYKLHAPHNTTVEVDFKDGKIKQLTVMPKEREKDVVIME